MFSQTELLLYLVMILSSAFYALSAPFLPIMFDQKNISGEYVGFVFAAFSVALIIFSPQIGRMIERFGQPNLLGFGLTLMGLSVISFGFVESLNDPATIIIMSLFLRFVQGKQP